MTEGKDTVRTGESPREDGTAPRRSLSGRVIGDIAWQPPAWMGGLAARMRSQPRLWIGGSLAALAVIALLVWWVQRPAPIDPDAIEVTLQAPAATDYGRTPPAIADLVVGFSAPAAPLEAIGDAGERTREPQGLRLSPAHPGTWTWRDDQQLVFTPAEDWPVGQSFTLRIDPRVALASDSKLAETRHTFETAPFELAVRDTEFYQDPEDPSLKRGIFTLAFSHPVDAAGLESRLSLQMRDGADRRMAAPGLSVRYDERRLTAWVQSDGLEIPENGGRLLLEVRAGVSSDLPGRSGADEAAAEVVLPSLYSVSVATLEPRLVDNERFEPEQVLVLAFNQSIRDQDVAGAVRAWLLPEQREPRAGETPPDGGWPVPYRWSNQQVDQVLLDASEPLELTPQPAEREWSEAHSFRFQAPAHRRIYVRVDRGLRSFGGFLLGDAEARVLQVPPYPELLRFVGDGALLSLRGERRVTVVGRNLAHARLEVGRVMPDQLHHLVGSGSGAFTQPHLYSIGEDALVERFEQRLDLPTDDPAQAHYRGLDLGRFFTPTRRGVFLLSLRKLEPRDLELSAEERIARGAGREHDRRMVVLTDLGVIAKQNLDQTRDVFVQSLSTGRPVSGARVQVIARNGETLLTRTSDADGRARLPDLSGFRRERQATLLTIVRDDDLSFLPLQRFNLSLNTSRFDVGGEPNDRDPGALNATVFSDRGLYRPGETVHLGMVLRTADWTRSPEELPLELEVTDPRGNVALHERVAFGADGFEEARFTPGESAATGTWQATVYLLEDRQRRTTVGSTSVQVREFLPDTLRVTARLSTHNPQGWVHPADLRALVDVENLFGTPAQDRRVESRLNLRPVLPSFSRWPGFRFHDPRRARDGVSETLEPVRTDDDGHAAFDLELGRFERATYRLDLLVRAFEPGSGRGVAAQAGALVSEAEHLVGIRAPDPLNWINRGDRREVELVSIGPDGAARGVQGLRAVKVERRFVSVLTQANDGLYRYVSRERRDDRNVQPLALGDAPQRLRLDTSTPGDWTLEIRDADDTVLNSVDWTVAGAANLSRSMDRNAELAITLSKGSYAPGEEIEISLRAPYAGRGLITIERDRVYAHAWFEADTTASVQRIRVPEGVEGNAYVSVQYLRSPDSDEIFTSPLSWGVAPFEIDREARTLPLSLDVPATARPGQPVDIIVRTGEPARVAVFAVDEGILQVAGYRVPDPLDHFFRKRMHDVGTAQILDLLLPEFSRFQALMAAPGGDAEGGAARHLNPFRRRGEAPAVWWSGLVEVDGERRLRYTMPDHFNGQLRVVAVAVNAQRMGIAEAGQRVRGDFVLTPTVPTHVAPGDVFELPVGIANTTENAGDGALQVRLHAEATGPLALDGDAPAALSLRPGEEGVARLRLRAGDAPGVAVLTLRAGAGQRAASRRIEVSVRPPTVPEATLRVARVEQRTRLGNLRNLHAERAERSLAASASPLVAVDAFGHWLQEFPHYCTEQLVSMAMPALVQARHPEFGGGNTATERLAELIAVLRTRQNGEGGFGYWRAEMDAAPFVSVYTALALVEARERELRVPDDMLAASNGYLRDLARDASRTALHEQRARALAVYLLARQGQSVGDLLATLQTQLERDHPESWRDDTAGALVAASFALLRQDRAAAPLAQRQRELAANALPQRGWDFAHFSDPLVEQAWRLYLLHRHFPRQAERLPAGAIEGVIGAVRDNRFNTLSLGLATLALESAGVTSGAVPRLEAAAAGGQPRAIGETIGRMRRAGFDGSVDRLWVSPGEDGAPAWYALSESGFERAAPAAVQDRGLEVLREYLDAQGRPTTTVAVGDELEVRLRVRSRESRSWEHVAISDLLPGGFELVLDPRAAAEGEARSADDAHEESFDGGDETGVNQEGDATPRTASLALPGTTFSPDHVDLREDRVVLYGTVAPQAREFRYRIRAGSVGEFAIPPVHAESMYRQDVLARGGPAGRLTVTPED